MKKGQILEALLGDRAHSPGGGDVEVWRAKTVVDKPGVALDDQGLNAVGIVRQVFGDAARDQKAVEAVSPAPRGRGSMVPAMANQFMSVALPSAQNGDLAGGPVASRNYEQPNRSEPKTVKQRQQLARLLKCFRCDVVKRQQRRR